MLRAHIDIWLMDLSTKTTSFVSVESIPLVIWLSFRKPFSARSEQDNQISLYNTGDITRMSESVDSGRQPQSKSVANYLVKQTEAGELLNGNRLALKLQLAQKSGIARGTIWCTTLPKRCSDSFGLTRAQDSSPRFSMPHPCSVRLKIGLRTPWWNTPESGRATLAKYPSIVQKIDME